MFETLIPYALSAWIAGFIAFGELTSRYRVLSLPHGVRSGAVWAYLLVNAGAGVTGTALVQAFAPGLGPFASSFIGAFGALMFLRSSVMSVRSGTIEVPIGPAGILSLLLSTADRAIDRSSAEEVAALGRLLESVPFPRLAESLPRYLLALSRPSPDGTGPVTSWTRWNSFPPALFRIRSNPFTWQAFSAAITAQTTCAVQFTTFGRQIRRSRMNSSNSTKSKPTLRSPVRATQESANFGIR